MVKRIQGSWANCEVSSIQACMRAKQLTNRHTGQDTAMHGRTHAVVPKVFASSNRRKNVRIEQLEIQNEFAVDVDAVLLTGDLDQDIEILHIVI